MITRNMILLLACWSLVASPLLCLAGAMEHACHAEVDVAASDPCATPECPCDPHTSSCPHETDCSNDPCSVVVPKCPRTSPDEIAPLQHADRFLATGIDTACPRKLPPGTDCHTPARHSLPVHPSDLPLLI